MRERPTEAKEICSRCQVILECRAANDEAEGDLSKSYLFGVYGGETVEERLERRRSSPVR